MSLNIPLEALRSTRCAMPRAHVAVLMRDNGPGILDETLAWIFDPFFTTLAVGEGSGLGLDIVRRIVEQHDGPIPVESHQRKTEFIIHLPLAV